MHKEANRKVFHLFFIVLYMSYDEEDLAYLEDNIRNARQLPYTITVERVEGDIAYAKNQWGNTMKYKIVDDDYELLDE